MPLPLKPAPVPPRVFVWIPQEKSAAVECAFRQAAAAAEADAALARELDAAFAAEQRDLEEVIQAQL
jgi:hypothetical protein